MLWKYLNLMQWLKKFEFRSGKKLIRQRDNKRVQTKAEENIIID